MRSTVLLCAILAMFLLGREARARSALTGLKEGKPDLKSAGALCFGPGGVLFVADPQGAAIFAIETSDSSKPSGTLDVSEVDGKIAAVLGLSVRQILINDLAVHPTSHRAYVSASRGRGPDAAPALLRISGAGKVELMSLDKVKFSKTTLPDAPEVDRRRRNLRRQSITDIAYVDGRLLVAGLSNEEFASSLRSIPYPFDKADKGTSVEIYHGAHGRFETRSPVRTFATMRIGGESHVLAAYTCTPLVKFPLAQLKPGTHLKGTTIAELGNRNRPLDMITYQKDGKEFLLLSNSSRGVMKISTENIENAEGITERVPGGGRKGQPYETIESWQGIQQLDRLDAEHALVLRRTEGGALHLKTMRLP